MILKIAEIKIGQRVRDNYGDMESLANRMMARVKDEKGIRTVFACNVDGVHKYVDIDKSKDLPALKSVDNQLAEKRNGLELSCAKASRRRMEVEGQLSLDFEKGAVR